MKQRTWPVWLLVPVLWAAGPVVAEDACPPAADPGAEACYLEHLGVAESAHGFDSREALAWRLRLRGLYHERGDVDRAVEMAERVVELRDVDDPSTLHLVGLLADTYRKAGRHDEAERSYRDQTRLAEETGDPVKQAHAIGGLIGFLMARGDTVELRDLHSRRIAALEGVAATQENAGRMLPHALKGFAWYLQLEGQQAEAESVLRRIVTDYPGTDRDATWLAEVHAQISRIEAGSGRYVDAAGSSMKAVELLERLNETDHPVLENPLHQATWALLQAERFDAAVPVARRLLATRSRRYGPEHERTLWASQYLRRAQEAIPLTVVIGSPTEMPQGGFLDPEQQAQVTASHRRLRTAELFARDGQIERAEREVLLAREMMTAAVGQEHFHVAMTYKRLASMYQLDGQFDMAAPLYLEFVSRLEQAPEGPWRNQAALLVSSANALREMGSHDEAIGLLRRAIAAGSEQGDGKLLAEAHRSLAGTLHAQGSAAEAIATLEASLDHWRSAAGPASSEVAQALYLKADWLAEEKRWEEAIRTARQYLAVDQRSKLPNEAVAEHMRRRIDEWQRRLDDQGAP